MNQVVNIIDNTVYINGHKAPPLPKNYNYCNLTQIDGKIFYNGYQLINNKWKRTFQAFWHLWF